MLQLSRAELLQSYRVMTTIRRFEDLLHVAAANGEIPGFLHLSAGQEAAAVAVCQQLTGRDYIASTHRGHGHCLAKGSDPYALMKEIYGKADGICKGKGGSMHMADPDLGLLGTNGISGAGVPLACGAALAAKTLGTGGIAVAFVGDGAANQGTTFESLNLAVIWNLPAIFVFENNGYAMATAASYAIPSGDIARRAVGFGIRAQVADGTDFFAVYDAFLGAAERARAGLGPSLVELKLQRYYGHFEGDEQTYRAVGEIEAARASKDCLKLFRKRVIETVLLEPAELDAVDADVEVMIARAIEEARSAPYPPPGELLTDVYASY